MRGKNTEFYSTQELAKADWFPLKSTITITKLVEQGELDAVNISTNPDRKRYRITKKSATEFIERRKSNKQ